MLVNSNYNINHNQYLYKKPTFGNLASPKLQPGILKKTTINLIEDFLHRYDEIISILERKTPEGLEKLAQLYPNITIGENLVFHNCGENKNSISIRVARSNKYRGLTYIARKEGSSEFKIRNTLNSFMISNKDKLVSNYNPNSSKYFPEDRKYFSEEELSRGNYDEELQKLLNDLDPVMIEFGKILLWNSDKYNKLPDGKLDFSDVSEIKKAFRICQNIEEEKSKISKKRMLRMNQNFADLKPVSGLQNIMFQNLGDEKLSIYMTEYENKEGFNLKRLYVYDKDSNLKKAFLIVDNEKFVKNLDKNNPNSLPRRFIYANSEELKSEFLPEFKKYFDLYESKLKEYEKYVNKTVDSYLKTEICGKFPIVYSEILSEALDWYNLAKIKLRKLPSDLAIKTKEKVENLPPATGRTGFWYKDDKNRILLQFLPISSRQYNNLLRISITNMENSEKKEFLIHEFKYIVKNYNPEYPTIIPKFLKYATEDELEESQVTNYFRILRNKTEELAVKADETYDKINEIRLKERKERGLERAKERAEKKAKEKENKDEYMNLIKECKMQFNQAIKNADKDVCQFNKTILDIQNAINDYIKSMQKKSS